jgi:outer membrane immunogenic protein
MKAIILGAILGFESIAPSLAALGSSRVSLVTPSTTSSSINGGAAVTSDHYEDITTVSGAVLGSMSQTRWGGTAGAGVEYGFTPNWTAAFEYDRVGKNVTYIGPAGLAFANKQLTRDVDLFTVRANYKFGSQEVARF